MILTPDQRVRVFVSSTLEELAEERAAVRRSIESLHLAPVLFELGARPHPPRSLYRAYLEQSHVFIALYWQRYGWVAPGMDVSGLEDEYLLSAGKPRLVYVKRPAPEREPRLTDLLDHVREAGDVSYRAFETTGELERLVLDDLVAMLSETFQSQWTPQEPIKPLRARPALPAPPTRFVGRQDELVQLRELLLNARLITLTGPGGIGKTRMALQLASDVAAEFADGAAFIGLASLHDPELVATTVASAVGVRDEGPGRILETLVDHLAQRRMLLVLDNFEHLLAASEIVTELIEAAPGLTLLITSREALRLRAEREFSIGSLPKPDGVELFAQQAAAVRHGFVVDEHNAETINRIVTALEGVPLAIELAAARTRLLPPEEILDRLDRSLDFLSGGARDLPERQRALRATLDWSHDLLGDSDRELFARLGVFTGSFSLAAAEAVGGRPDRPEALEGLTSLVDKSLLRVEASDREPRFRMLAMMREYAVEQLGTTEDLPATARRHAEYYRDLSRQLGPIVRGPDQAECVDRLSRGTGTGDIDNVRTAMRWYLTHDQPGSVADILWALWLLGWISGRLVECRGWAREALSVGSALDPEDRTRLLTVAGLLDMWLGNYSASLPALNEGVVIAREIGDDDVLATSLLGLSLVSSFVGDTDVARVKAEEALTLFRARADRWGQATGLSLLTWFIVGDDSFDANAEGFEEALVVANQLADDVNRAMIETNVAEQQLHLERYDEAAALLGRSLRRYSTVRALYPSSYAIDCAARLAARTERSRIAATLLGAGNHMRQIIGVPGEGSHQSRRALLEQQIRVQHVEPGLYDEALAGGESMTFEEAIQYAIEAVAHHFPTPPARLSAPGQSVNPRSFRDFAEGDFDRP